MFPHGTMSLVLDKLSDLDRTMKTLVKETEQKEEDEETAAFVEEVETFGSNMSRDIVYDPQGN